MLLGIDFDNTIVCYDTIFHQVAVEQNLVPSDLTASKLEVRNYLRSEGREDEWTLLQGEIYGNRMIEAAPFPGAFEFFQAVQETQLDVCIISHRTKHPFAGPQYDLHDTARRWLQHWGFFEKTGLARERAFYQLTKQDKWDRIRNEGCQWFIDDLPEFLGDEGFPKGVERVLFDPSNSHTTENRFRRVSSWSVMMEWLQSGVFWS